MCGPDPNIIDNYDGSVRYTPLHGHPLIAGGSQYIMPRQSSFQVHVISMKIRCISRSHDHYVVNKSTGATIVS